MGRPQQTPQHIVDAALVRYRNGESAERIARDAGVSRATVYNWVRGSAPGGRPAPELINQVRRLEAENQALKARLYELLGGAS